MLQGRHSFFKPYTPLAFAVDLLLNVGAILLSFTLYSSSSLLLNGLLLSAAIFVYALPPLASSSRRKKQPKLPPSVAAASSSKQKDAPAAAAAADPQHALSTKPFLTNFRGCMMVATCLAILAVDFRLFPRRFAKVETWGTSLMDIGVGSFVFSAGVVGARPVLKERSTTTKSSETALARRLFQSFRHSLPLFALGIVRLLSVKGLDYAEHVTEYGVHWNFFFTLGLLPPFVALFQSASRYIPSYAGLAVLLSFLYQVALETTSLKAYILTAPRTDLISMNREGIFSFLGYLAIFLAGQDTGMVVLPRRLNTRGSTASSVTGSQRKRLVLNMATRTVAWCMLCFVTTDYKYGAGLAVSRRLANLPYMLFVVAFNCAQVTAMCLIDVIFFPGFYSAQDARLEKEMHDQATSRVLRAFNRNGLAIFLVANLLTGLVNMTVPTLDVGQLGTLGILIAYSSVLTGFAVALDMYNITLKL